MIFLLPDRLVGMYALMLLGLVAFPHVLSFPLLHSC
jgi:hypothetical protein